VIHAQETIEKFTNANAPSQNIGKVSSGISGYDLAEYFVNNQAVKGSRKYQY
jgi:hypothetical protein